jgi:transcriptional regulator with XRE-family HTH domain
VKQNGFRGFGQYMYEDIVINLAKRVQQLRKNLGMTQASLAARAGVTVETVARLERVVRGRFSSNTNPSLETLTRIATALEIEPHTLLAPEPVEPRKSHQLTYLLERASPASTRRILCVAEALLREEHAEGRPSGVHSVPPKTINGEEHLPKARP